jgi:hypothetical protein
MYQTYVYTFHKIARVGASGELVDKVSERMVEEKVRMDRAKELINEFASIEKNE